jgi:hypothetical protein
MKTTSLLCLFLAAFNLLNVAQAVESIHFGYQEANPTLTDDIRLSTRIGYAWWSANTKRYNVENGSGIPYSYHDGYVEWIGVSKTPTQAAQRWQSILNGQGDPWTGASGLTVGMPTIILLDEINSNFKNSGQGPALREALRLFIVYFGGNRSQIVALASPAISQGTGVTASNYGDVIYSANNYLRFLALEVYCSHKGYITGYDPGDPTFRGTDDTYLANRLAFGIRNWTTTMGVSASRIMPMFAISNWAESQGTTSKSFYKFLNRQFWFLANGWYNASHSGVDANIKTALRNGVGSYNWAPGTSDWQLTPSKTTRDSFHEKYIMWYSVGGNLNAHGDGVDAR